MTSTTPTATAVTVSDDTIKSAIHAAVAVPSDLAPFRAITDTKARNRVRKAVEARSRSAAFVDGDPVEIMAEVRRLATIVDTMKSARSAAPKVVVDPMVTLRNRAATLRLAADLIDAGIAAPDGIDPVTVTYGHSMGRHAGTPNVSSAFTLAATKVTRSGPTNDVAAAVRAAMAHLAVGDTMTTTAISHAWEAAGGPPASATGGRINARLTAPNGCTIVGVDGCLVGDDQVQGAIVTAPLS